jgi:hypothetical protein
MRNNDFIFVLFVCIYECVYLCKFVFMYLCVCVCISRCCCLLTRRQVFLWSCLHASTYVCLLKRVSRCCCRRQKYWSSCVYMPVLVCMYVCMCIFVKLLVLLQEEGLVFFHTCIHTQCMHVCMYFCLYVSMFMLYIYTHTHDLLCIHVCHVYLHGHRPHQKCSLQVSALAVSSGPTASSASLSVFR